MKYLVALAAAFALAVLPFAARAGELDLTGDLTGFSSPDDVYGPWQALSGTYRWQASASDTPSITFITRADRDRLDPTHSNGVTVDDYHDWSPRFFTYAAAGFAAGGVLPTRDFYLEGDQKFGRNLATVFGGGVGVVINPNGVDQRYINVGPSFYYNKFNMTFRYLQTFTTGRTGTGTGIATFEAGETGHTISTLTLLAGDQPPNGLVTAAQTIDFGQRTIFAGIGVKHWTSSKGGFLAGVSFERLTDRLSGDPIYFARNLEVGIFRNIGPALP
jgi:YaiO family outer membrane protein